jgi:hypothetical protein
MDKEIYKECSEKLSNSVDTDKGESVIVLVNNGDGVLCAMNGHGRDIAETLTYAALDDPSFEHVIRSSMKAVEMYRMMKGESKDE